MNLLTTVSIAGGRFTLPFGVARTGGSMWIPVFSRSMSISFLSLGGKASRVLGRRPSGKSGVSGGRSGGRGRNDTVSAEENAVFASMSAKNQIISHKSVSELCLATIRDLQVQ